MAIELKNKTNTIAPNSEYPYGDIRDDDGSSNGTPVDRTVYADMHQFFARMFEKVKEQYPLFDYNDQPDNAYDGFQYFEALLKTRPFKIYTGNISQNTTNAPTVVLMSDQNTIGSIVWTRVGAGQYRGTLSGVFVASKTWLLISGYSVVAGEAFFGISRLSNDVIAIESKNDAGVYTDSLLDSIAIEIRVYP